MDSQHRSLGICIGASSIKAAELTRAADELRVGRTRVLAHRCDVRGALQALLAEYPLNEYDYACVTGRKSKELLNLPAVTEPEAVERAVRFCLHEASGPFRALVSLGAETFMAYELEEDGTIIDVRTGNKCAVGSGEFFLQQIGRMDLTPDEAGRLAQGAAPYCVSGRCSVFSKSDCTHALNKGIPKERVCAGLGNMMAERVLEILGTLPRRDVLAVGGVTRNAYVLGRLREKIENLIVPQHAEVFEALGAAICAMERQARVPASVELVSRHAVYGRLPPLDSARTLVTFREAGRGQASAGDETVLGLDVGSTTTKAVLLRTSDDQMLASVYLRTNGDPIRASRHCYAELARQLHPVPVRITGLGVTGSGRYIAALHAQTGAVVNEIIAHATAAAFYDEEVDTILEIGGQDAKYTHLVGGVPCDYAMNEACSAGTGSFLEEAAKESLGIDVRDIEEIAVRAKSPANLSDQCAAFIASDVKSASHEMEREDVVAGLVYSISMNYNNRVRGPRPVGRKIFMQGGVCYNRAVPLAMAALLDRPILVPPEPGLMGAFGVALEVKRRLATGGLAPSSFELEELAGREVRYGKSFVCPGKKERCDRGCAIHVIRLEGKSFPFGGICNKYYNLAHDLRIDPQPYDFVAQRQQAVFRVSPNGHRATRGTVGLTRSFFTNLLYPLYRHFFTALGFDVVLSDAVDSEGVKRVCASFCFPVQLAHGMMMDLTRKRPDYIFLPQIDELHVAGAAIRGSGYQSTCVAVQGEPFYLRSAFRDLKSKVLSPQLNWSRGWGSMQKPFVEMAVGMGCDRRRAAQAYGEALRKLEAFFAERTELGREALREIESDAQRTGVVLFGRCYNAFAGEANMGIPKKFASRGVHCIPCDCLPTHAEPSVDRMTWAEGHEILRAARFVKRHPQLFAVFLTNFSCGPDSFLVSYVRDVMKTKPSLTLEIDSHTADAGVTTRVEAFLDVVARYRRLGIGDPAEAPFRKARVVLRRAGPVAVASDGGEHALYDPRVKVIFPSMGRTLAELAAASFRGFGIRAEAVPLPSTKTLMLGRANASCKECLPLILSTGSMVEYAERHRSDGELLLYFMPRATGGCRLPQYPVHLDKIIEKRRIRDLAVLSLASEKSYGGLGLPLMLTLVKATVVADAMDDVRNALCALAFDRPAALRAFEAQWRTIVACFARRRNRLYHVLDQAARRLAAIPLKRPLAEAPRVLLAGESYVRKDEFCSQAVIDGLARRGIVVERSPLWEWIQYVDYWVRHIDRRRLSLTDQFELRGRILVQRRIEKRIKRLLAQSGLCGNEVTEIDDVIRVGERFLNHLSGGEPVLVVGRFFRDVLRDFDGMISIGPFACLPTRVVESIITPESRTRGNDRLAALPNAPLLNSVAKLPFLTIEVDGNPLPQIIEAQLEAFALQVERLHGRRYPRINHARRR